MKAPFGRLSAAKPPLAERELQQTDSRCQVSFHQTRRLPKPTVISSLGRHVDQVESNHLHPCSWYCIDPKLSDFIPSIDGDRTGALRQFEVCVKALAQELDVKPAARTLDLYEQIREDNPLSLTLYESDSSAVAEERVSLPALLQRLNHVRTTLIQAQRQIEQDIEIVETVFGLK